MIILIVVGSLFQVDYLRKGLTFLNLDFSWVQGNLLNRSDSPCLNCGAETTKMEAVSISFKPERIIISSVDIDLKVVSVPLKNGTWDVLPQVANFAEGTSPVNNKEGNTGIFAHARLDAFKKIKNLKDGDEIVLTDGIYIARYIVNKTGTVEPTDISVFYPTKDPVITLITCDGFFDEKRFMVRARLSTIEKLHYSSKNHNL